MSTAPDANPPAPMILAREPDFNLGGVTVSPSTGLVFKGKDEVRLQRRVMQVLVTFARHAGETVTFDQLIEICWDGCIVGDDAVHRVLGQLRQLARRFDPPPFTLQTVPRIGFRLAPADPSADPAQPAGPRPAQARPRPQRTPLFVGLAAVALALIAGLAWWAASARQPLNGKGDVAVAGFQSLASDPQSLDLAQGIREGIVNSLVGAGVGVVAPDAKQPATATSELLVEGSIESVAGVLTVKPQIRDRASQVILWTGRYSAAAEQSGGLAHDVANDIAFNLHCALQDRATARVKVSTQVLQLYLNTCGALRSSDEAPERMLAMARKLVGAAPDFASAHAMHGVAAAFAAFGSSAPDAEQRLLSEARQAADTAIRLDRRTPKAYVAREMSRPNTDWAAREDDLVTALGIDPDLPPPAVRYVGLLSDTGRFAKAVEVSKRSSETRDPRASEADAREPLLLAASGNLPAARQSMDRMDRIRPHRMDAVRWTIETWWGDPALAPAPAAAIAAGLDPTDVDCAKAILARPASAPAPGPALPPACAGVRTELKIRLLARQGDIAGALALLEHRPPGSRAPIRVLYYPELAALRNNARFEGLAERLGLIAYWRQPGRRPDFCGKPAAPPVCGRL